MTHEKDCDCDPCVSRREYIERLVDEAPPLTAEQRAKLAELLGPIRRLD